jgi:hypothetical protein
MQPSTETRTDHLSIQSIRTQGDNGRNLVDKLVYARKLKTRATKLVNEIRNRFLVSDKSHFFGTSHIASIMRIKIRRLDPDKVRALIDRLIDPEDREQVWNDLHSDTVQRRLTIRPRNKD